MILLIKWSPLSNCTERNEVIPTGFGGTIHYENGLEQYILVVIDRFSKYPTKETKKSIQHKCVYIYIYIYIYIYTYIYDNGDPRSIILDRARCLTGKKFEEFRSEKIVESSYAPAHDDWAIEFDERLILTKKTQLSRKKILLIKENSF